MLMHVNIPIKNKITPIVINIITYKSLLSLTYRVSSLLYLLVLSKYKLIKTLSNENIK